MNRSLARRKGFKNGDIVPPLFLYRHPVELLTKAVLLPGNELLTYYGEGEATTMIFERFRSWNHRLLPMLNPMQKLLKDVRWAWYWPDSRVETFNDVRAMFRDLDSIDPRAASLRYPVNLKGERSIPVNVVIGLQTTFSSLDDLAEALDTVVLALDAECSQLGFAP